MARYIQQLRRGWKDDERDDWAEYESTPDHILPLEGELVLEYDHGIPRLKIGDGVTEFSQLPYLSAESFMIPSKIFLDASQWQQATDKRWYQIVEVTNARITKNSMVNIQLSAEQLETFLQKQIAFVAENEDGVIYVYCVGQVPTSDYEMQVTVTEVAENG